MRIGDLAQRADVSVRSLRYYEEQGLLSASRTTSGQRIYAPEASERVRLIQQFFSAGLSSRVIAQILPIIDSGVTTDAALGILSAERRRLRENIAEMSEALSQLSTVIDHAIHHANNPDRAACTYQHDEAV